MKEKDFNNSLQSFQQLKVEIELIKKTIEKREFYPLEIFLIEEPELLAALKISRSTFFKYRKIYGIKAIPLFGRNVYLKHLVYEKVIDLSIKKSPFRAFFNA